MIKQLSVGTRQQNCPSLMFKAILPDPPFTTSRGRSLEAFPLLVELVELLPKWLVVMRTIIIHCDYKTAAMTGLFGPLGDALIVIVDVCKDPERAEALFKFAKICEYQGQGEDQAEPILVSQDFRRETKTCGYQGQGQDQAKPILVTQDLRRETPEMMKRVLNDLIYSRYQSVAFVARMHPAIMYRRCPRRCNRRKHNYMSYRD